MAKRYLVTLLLLACSAAHAGLNLLPGSSPQTVKSGDALAPIRVGLTDDHGVAVKGAPITYSISSTSTAPAVLVPPPTNCYFPNGIASAPVCPLVTDDSGILMLPAFIGNYPGHYLLSISTPGYAPVTVDFTVTPLSSPPVLTVLSNAPVLPGFLGQTRVKVTRDGQPVANELVRMTITVGSGPIAFTTLNATNVTLATTSTDGVATSPAWLATGGLGTGFIDIQTVTDNSLHDVTVRTPYAVVDWYLHTYYPYKPLWWGGAAQSGWGVAMPQHTEHIFPVYFSYDSANRPTWKVLQGEWVGGIGNGFRGNLYEYAGAPYFAFDTSKVRVIGSVPTYLAFNNQTTYAFLTLNANLGNLDPPPPATQLSIKPFSFAPAINWPEHGVSDIWWGGPSQSGWGIHIAEDQGNLFLTWFTYDADGRATWFVMPDGQWTDGSTWTGSVYRTTGSNRAGADYDPAMYRATKVGDFTIRFSGTTAATFTYNVDGHAGTLNLQRFDY